MEGNGYNFITAKIPYDAVALSTNETGTKEFIQSSVQFSVTNGNTSILSVPAMNIESILFEGDRLRFSGQSSPFKYYTIASVIGNIATLTNVFFNIGRVQESITGHYGRRDDQSSSKRYCEFNKNLCDTVTVSNSGSL